MALRLPCGCNVKYFEAFEAHDAGWERRWWDASDQSPRSFLAAATGTKIAADLIHDLDMRSDNRRGCEGCGTADSDCDGLGEGKKKIDTEQKEEQHDAE